MRRRQNFEEKTGKKGVFKHFLDNFEQKLHFFWSALSPKN